MENEEQQAIPDAADSGPRDLSSLTLYMLGHAHIDLCYRWDIEETVHRIGPMTFRGVLDVMGRTPGFTFCQSQMFLYEAMEKEYPLIFARIVEQLGRGQWEAVGGAWCEYDAMLASGEAVIRQHLQGMRYAADSLGVTENRVAFVPDAFIGHAATLPQILSGCGIQYYLFCRGIPEGQKRAFRWVGPDGSSVVAYQPFGPYNNSSFTPAYVQKLAPYADSAATPCDLALYGVGDHGGGPRDRDIEALESLDSLPTAPRWRYGTAHDFFAKVLGPDRAAGLSEHLGNMRSFATGAITSQARIKRENRICEHLLVAAEATASATTPLQYKPAFPRLDFIRLWRTLLTNQFHDTLPGTSVPSVYRQAQEDYRGIRREAELLIEDSMRRIGARMDTRGEGYPILIHNLSTQPQTGLVHAEYPEWGNIVQERAAYRLVDAAGQETPASFGEGSLVFPADVPSLGYALYRAIPGAPKPHPGPPPPVFRDSTFENAHFRLCYDTATGDLSEVYDKSLQRPVCGNPSFSLELHEEEAKATAWTLGLTGEMRGVELVEGPAIVEETPFYARVVVRSRSRWSTFCREVTLYTHLRRIDLRISTEWHDTNALLKLGFRAGAEAPCVTASIAHGFTVVENPETEFCCHDWVHLGDSAGGVGFLNDGAYGADFRDGRLGISVVRNTRDMDPGMDHGRHELKLSLVSLSGPFRQSELRRALPSLVHPLRAMWETDHPGPLSQWGKFDQSDSIADAGSFASLGNENVEICALKMLEEHYAPDAFVIRLRELDGLQTVCDLELQLPCRSLWRADHLERPVEKLSDGPSTALHPEIKPYEIVTLIAYL